MAVKGKGCKKKGSDFEREIAKRFVAGGYLDAHREPQFTGPVRPDVDGTPFWVECKKGPKPNLRGALRQAERDSDSRIPIGVIRDDNTREDAMVVLRLEHFLHVAKWGAPAGPETT